MVDDDVLRCIAACSACTACRACAAYAACFLLVACWWCMRIEGVSDHHGCMPYGEERKEEEERREECLLIPLEKQEYSLNSQRLAVDYFFLSLSLSFLLVPSSPVTPTACHKVQATSSSSYLPLFILLFFLIFCACTPIIYHFPLSPHPITTTYHHKICSYIFFST